MRDLLVALLLWIGTQTGYQADVQPPKLIFMPLKEVSAICIDEGRLVPLPAESCYKLHKHTIYIPDDFDIEAADKVGVLVHELTHVLQLANGRIYDFSTMDLLESEADRLEEIYENSPAVQEEIKKKFSRPLVVAKSDRPAGSSDSDQPQAINVYRQRPAVDTRRTAPQSQGETVAPFSEALPTEDHTLIEEASEKNASETKEDLYPCDVLETKYFKAAIERDLLKKKLFNAQEELNLLTIEILSLQKETKELKARIVKLETSAPSNKTVETAAEPGGAEDRESSQKTIQEAYKQAILEASKNTKRSYTIKKGDSLWLIARKFQISVKSLKKFNNLESNKLKPGQTLLIPE